ncbi:MAG: hypothetical protein MJZ16_00570 [Bacteroidales bacterium]|nr:hypothetical protein [Bacteroidales bacterium]
MKDNTTIPSVIKEIGEDYVVYKTFDNQEGPDYRISLSKIQKIKYSNGKEESFTTAFTNTLAGVMTKKGDYLRLDGRKLLDDEVESIIGSDIYNATYIGARKQIKTANTLLITGAASALSGLVLYVYADNKWYDALYSDGNTDMFEALCGVGSAILIAGCFCLDACIPISIIGSSRMKWIASDYNQRAASQANLNVGLQKHGIGLALNF